MVPPLKKAELNDRYINIARSLVDFMDGYFNIEYYGLENIPIGSRFVWTHNHSGWPSLDAVVIGKKIGEANQQHTGTFDPGLAFWHDLVTKLPVVGEIVKGFGGISIKDLEHYNHWQEHQIFVTPAEGEAGNFKSSFKSRYKLAPFRSGIGRIACLGQVKFLLPVSIMGPEESFPNLGTIRIPFKKMTEVVNQVPALRTLSKKWSKKYSKDFLIPVLLPIQGIPISWYVHFHKPIDISFLTKKADTNTYQRDLYQEISKLARTKIEADLNMRNLLRTPFRLKVPSWNSQVNPVIFNGLGKILDGIEDRTVPKFNLNQWAYGNAGQKDYSDNLIHLKDFRRKTG